MTRSCSVWLTTSATTSAFFLAESPLNGSDIDADWSNSRIMHVGLARVIWAEYIGNLNRCRQWYRSRSRSSGETQIQHQRQHRDCLFQDINDYAADYTQRPRVDGHQKNKGKRDRTDDQAYPNADKQNLQPVSSSERTAALEDALHGSVLQNRDWIYHRQRQAHDDTRNKAQHVTEGLKEPRGCRAKGERPDLGQTPAKGFVHAGFGAGFQNLHQRIDQRGRNQHVTERAEQQRQQRCLPILSYLHEGQCLENFKWRYYDKDDVGDQPDI